MDPVNSPPPAQTLTGTILSLLQTGKLSDLTLKCQDREFLVHQAIVCPRSPVWTAAVQGKFKESATREVEIDIADPHTLLRALTYLYTGDYDDEKLQPIDYVVLDQDISLHQSNDEPPDNGLGEMSGEPQGLQQTEIENDPATAPIVPTEPNAENTSIQHESSTTATNNVDNTCDCFSSNRDKIKPGCQNAKLRTNVLVYTFADYYDIPDLKYLAVKKFTKALESVCAEGFGDICQLVFESSTPDAQDLRSYVVQAVVENGPTLIENMSFMDTVSGLPNFLRDCLVSFTGNCQITAEARDIAYEESLAYQEQYKEAATLANDEISAANTLARYAVDEANKKAQNEVNAANLKAQNEVTEAHKKADMVMERMVAEVNRAKQCRHCKLANHLFYEKDHFLTGQPSYSLRCNCRTKF